MVNRPLISVVDDDESVRESLPDLLREFGFTAQSFSSAEEFLASDYLGQTRCLVLDIAMPGMTGPEAERGKRSFRISNITPCLLQVIGVALFLQKSPEFFYFLVFFKDQRIIGYHSGKINN